MSRIKRLVRRSGWNFTFLYLKEAQRLFIRALAGSPDTLPPKGIRVQRDARGLPMIIPGPIRHTFPVWLDNQVVIKTTLTLLSVFRVFPTKPKPKLGTITEPWIGLCKSLPQLKTAVCEIIPRTLRVKKPSLIFLESAGPNFGKSGWSSGWDLLAFIHDPIPFY